MTVKEFLKIYYGLDKELDIRDQYTMGRVYKELILPGTYKTFSQFLRDMKWNLDRDCYFSNAYQMKKDGELYVTVGTRVISLHLVFDDSNEFLNEFIKKGLRKHKDYVRETLSSTPGQFFLFTSPSFEHGKRKYPYKKVDKRKQES